MTGKQVSRKSDRALELFEKGLDTGAISERLGTTVTSVCAMLIQARKRREREIERAGRLADAMGANV